MLSLPLTLTLTPLPPLSPQGQMMADQAAPGGTQGSQGAQPGSAPEMPYSSYARRLYTHMIQSRLHQNSATWDAHQNGPNKNLLIENPMLTHPKSLHMQTLNKMLLVLNSLSVMDLDRFRPSDSTRAWSFDDVQFMKTCIGFCVDTLMQQEPRDMTPAACKLLILPFHSVALDKAHVNRILQDSKGCDIVSA